MGRSTTKLPQALRGAPGFKAWESKNITETQVVFEGPVLEAVALFPANVNVAALSAIEILRATCTPGPRIGT